MRVGKYLAVTNHAINRLEQRMNITGYPNIAKAVKKAWYNTQPICEEFWRSRINFQNNGCTTYHYKKYNNCIFCFQKKYSDVVLITVFSEDKELLKQEYEDNSKKIIKRNYRESFLQEMYPPKNRKMRRKNNPRACNNLRRKSGK